VFTIKRVLVIAALAVCFSPVYGWAGFCAGGIDDGVSGCIICTLDSDCTGAATCGTAAAGTCSDECLANTGLEDYGVCVATDFDADLSDSMLPGFILASTDALSCGTGTCTTTGSSGNSCVDDLCTNTREVCTVCDEDTDCTGAATCSCTTASCGGTCSDECYYCSNIGELSCTLADDCKSSGRMLIREDLLEFCDFSGERRVLQTSPSGLVIDRIATCGEGGNTGTNTCGGYTEATLLGMQGGVTGMMILDPTGTYYKGTVALGAKGNNSGSNTAACVGCDEPVIGHEFELHGWSSSGSSMLFTDDTHDDTTNSSGQGGMELAMNSPTGQGYLWMHDPLFDFGVCMGGNSPTCWYFTDDGNLTGPATGDLIVDTDTLVVKGDTNVVGIGIAAPLEKLEVNGNIKIVDVGTNQTTTGVISYDADVVPKMVTIGDGTDALPMRSCFLSQMKAYDGAGAFNGFRHSFVPIMGGTAVTGQLYSTHAQLTQVLSRDITVSSVQCHTESDMIDTEDYVFDFMETTTTSCDDDTAADGNQNDCWTADNTLDIGGCTVTGTSGTSDYACSETASSWDFDAGDIVYAHTKGPDNTATDIMNCSWMVCLR